MEKPEEPQPAVPGEPQASRLTTIVLIVSLVLVVLVAGVLGTVAVLMTRSPDAPLLGGVPPQRLVVPIHFAAVRETKNAPCPGVEAALDDKQTTCYLLEDGVTVNAVQRIEPVREKDGTYSVRIAVAPAFKERLVGLIDELAPKQRQVAVVIVPRTVVAAPVVVQGMDGDSLSITGFTKEDADALAARLLGGAPGSAEPSTGDPSAGAPTTGDPQTGLPSTGAPQTGLPQTGDPQTGTPPTGGPQNGTPQNGTPQNGSPQAGAPTTAPTTAPVSRGATGALDPKYASCKAARAAGDGPYSKGVHPEYDWYRDIDHNGVACNSADIT
ncbi:excalibur calcium-binding domain-containing protein [Nonomuraea sp. NPDC005983]|uniref:excalibur calcium-binding domain-containing protein n=1 Tax=Nonomuraea sp. NPDC005983 TaxID=3155595 RepID=UPI0033AAC658